MLQSGSVSAARKVRPWAFLTPDLLVDVSGRLQDAADFIRFHAVCTSWRDVPHSLAMRPKFLPWLLTQYQGRTNYMCVDVSSQEKSSFDDRVLVSTATATSQWDGNKNLVASADGRTVWFFTRSPEPRLVDLVTGTVTPLPHFPNPDDDDDDDHNDFADRMRNPQGIVYQDGTVFLYTIHNSHNQHRYCCDFTAALLRPGIAAWTIMQVMQNDWPGYNACAAYHHGKVFVWPYSHSLCTLSLGFQASGNHDTAVSELRTTRDSVDDDRRYLRYHCHLLESHGELLRASVLIKKDWFDGYQSGNPSRAMAVKVHALEKGPGNEMRWVARDGSSFVDRVFYLGTHASFSTKATQLGIRGGFAYFHLMDRVFRCSLVVDGEAEVMKQLRPGKGAKRTHVWLQPQPIISPIEKIRERLENPSK